MINRYHKYLEFLDIRLKKMFDSQAPFIKCKNGCAHCCKEGLYPISELEFLNVMFYYHVLNEDVQNKINKNVKFLLKNRREKYYQCPFLIDNSCSVYNARPIICRTFGLLTYNDKGHKKIPFCVDLGLNYADVYDKNLKKIVAKSEDGIEPVAFNIDRRYLRDKVFEKEFNIFFGEDKPLIDWLGEMEFFK